MPLTKYEDFLELSVNKLTDYLSVRALNTSGRKVESIARDFAAMELKLDIIQSSESQSNLLQSNYEKKLNELGIPDPKTVRENAVDDVTKWS